MNAYEDPIFFTYHAMSQMADIYQFVSEWSQILENKKEHDFQQIAHYDDEQSSIADYFLTQEYNHLYAHFLVTIYSALEYDLCYLTGLKDYDYKKFLNFLKDHNIKGNELKNINAVNLLRLYCNAYKHNGGFYTDEIISYEKDKKKCDEIQYLDLNIMEQYNFSYEFLFDLYGKLKR